MALQLWDCWIWYFKSDHEVYKVFFYSSFSFKWNDCGQVCLLRNYWNMLPSSLFLFLIIIAFFTILFIWHWNGYLFKLLWYVSYLQTYKILQIKTYFVYQGFLLNGQLTERHKAQKIILQNFPIWRFFDCKNNFHKRFFE